MNGGFTSPGGPFRLKPTRAATVSEISEATAASAVPPEERVNFHIGNPVQEEGLSLVLLRAVLGLDVTGDVPSSASHEALAAELGAAEEDLPAVQFLHALVRKSAPYLPRGGFLRTSPPLLVTRFAGWLASQAEPLRYDAGESSGRREIVLASGGITETLRVLFHALSGNLVRLPARVLVHGIALPAFCTSAPRLEFEVLPEPEPEAIARVRMHTTGPEPRPTFLVLGKQLSESARRALRQISLDRGLFFIEANDAPNHLSLAREARLVDSVLRFLTPGVLDPLLQGLSIVLVAGNADYCSLLETIHFQLKGTPSASEVELAAFLLGGGPRRESGVTDNFHGSGRPRSTQPGEGPGDSAAPSAERAGGGAEDLPVPVTDEGAFVPPSGGVRTPQVPAIVSAAFALGADVQHMIDRRLDGINNAGTRLGRRLDAISSRIQESRHLTPVDRFAQADPLSMVEALATHLGSPEWAEELIDSFAGAFLSHHPEYDRTSTVIVSGSSRTALGLLGFHCGISDVVTPDLSWTYEHCFPGVCAVPLGAGFQPDVRAILAEVDSKLAADSEWRNRGAVVLNNPHNATGRVFDAAAMNSLVKGLLERGVLVIDDLSYQNVAPMDGLPAIPTIRQIGERLVRSGEITSARTKRIITVHSLSKTDCLAGARLSVVEIRERELLERFRSMVAAITPNHAAVLLGYLFYRTAPDVPAAYWRLRNRILHERMSALTEALENLPPDRNPYGIDILPPTGSMYPLLVIHRLPAGLALDWVGAGLARQGIGMIPLSTFARTEDGFEAGRKAFRLTLGGTDGARTLLNKTRRVLIDLNRIIDEEQARYRRRTFVAHGDVRPDNEILVAWDSIQTGILREIDSMLRRATAPAADIVQHESVSRIFRTEFLPSRLDAFRQRFTDRTLVLRELEKRARTDGGRFLTDTLERELYKDNLPDREKAFRRRMFDRTVHPTQMYSLRTEAAFDALAAHLIPGSAPGESALRTASRELLLEFLGRNVAISSTDEAEEILLDLDAHCAAELYASVAGESVPPTFLSFWGDWDGSTRPSGQGHRLVASVLLENVRRMSRIMRLLRTHQPGIRLPSELLNAVERLPRTIGRFVGLLNEITALTHQLEGRYRGLLPVHAHTGRLRQLGIALRVARDPLASLSQHNDRLERRMRDLRQQRRQGLDTFLALNKQLRKELHAHIPEIIENTRDPQFLRSVAAYRDLLRRFVITPRIHQKLVTAQDPFAIDTTVFNIHELNDMGARYGNPGFVLALQVSMATRPEAIITLERKLRAQRDEVLRTSPEADLPSVWSVPLFEGQEAVQAIPEFLTSLWAYALQSRRRNQDTADRFSEIVPEVFIAGSDLSQQVGQAPGAALYAEAKHSLMLWLAGHGLAHAVRLKMGSGEPMQRQGGYYSAVSGTPAFLHSRETNRRFTAHLRHSTRTSTRYATTPMMGVFAGADLRTFQSALSEQLRFLPVHDVAQLFHHLAVSQRLHRRDLVRACEELAESRLTRTRHGETSIERLTVGVMDKAYRDFLAVVTENFRQILYGRVEDVVGIHVASYFIARATPPLRDRPTVRPSGDDRTAGRRIVERIASTIPLSNYGSLLRAIAHNQAQTAVLGVNQLTTGLFRAMDMYVRGSAGGEDPETFVAGRILPHLPVYEILESLRLYHDRDRRIINAVERSFPAGNSAFLALREDIDAMGSYLPLFQQELLRRHGVDVADFFEGARFIPDLLPTLRPDLAALLQPDPFNTDPDLLRQSIPGRVDEKWLESVAALLRASERIRQWRTRAWSLLESPVLQRVESFVDLAVSLQGISAQGGASGVTPPGQEIRLPSSLSHFFRMSKEDDDMRQFLAAAIEYLTSVSGSAVEIPANVARALREVERIAAIEEQALNEKQQQELRFCLLQIARTAGENG